MPEEAGRIRNGQLFLPICQHRRPHGGHQAQQYHNPKHGVKQLQNPLRMLQGKNIINKNLPHDRDGKSRNDHAEPQHHQEGKGPLVLPELGCHRFDNTVRFPFRLEVFTRRYFHIHAGIGLQELIPGHRSATHSRIVQVHRVPLESFQNQEMIEFPKQDKREFFFAQHLAAACEGLSHAALTTGCFQQVIRIAAVPGHAAFLPQHLQRQPTPIIGQDHSQ